MPRNKPSSAVSRNHSTKDDDNLDDAYNFPDSQTKPEETPVLSKGKKRTYDVAEPEEEAATGDNDFGTEMQKMLECFGADISKTLINKRKRLEQFTQNSLKTSNRKVEDIWKQQRGERDKLNDEYKRQLLGVFNQWDSDLEKTKDQEDKLQALFRQQQKMFQQTRVVQSQRLKTIKNVHEQYTKAMEELEDRQKDQQSTVHAELKKEMALLQKKILMDTQQQEMASVRKSLQTMLF